MEFRRGVSRKPVLLAWRMALGSCQSHRGSSVPSIELTRIPPAAQGGRERVDMAAGRAKDVRPEQQFGISAHSGQW